MLFRSQVPSGGNALTATAKWEKRNLASEIPVWKEGLCIQCNKCALACPHAAIRAKVFPAGELARAPEGFQAIAWKGAFL